MDDERIRAFLWDSLRLWRVDGVVEAAEPPLLAVIRTASGSIAWIERPSGDDVPFRWAVRWQTGSDASGEPRAVRPRACGSLVGVLSALRAAFEVKSGDALRIAPAGDDSAHSTATSPA